MKKIVSLTCSALLVGTPTSVVHGYSMEKDAYPTSVQVAPKGTNVIQDVDEKLQKMVSSVPYNFHSPYVLMGEANYDVFGTNILKTNIKETIPLHVGQNIFENPFSHESNYQTSIFSKAFTQTTTTTIQNGFKIGVTAKGKAGVPFVAEGEWSTTLEYNFSHTQANMNSETITLTAPAQPVKVPANKTYKVVVLFEQTKVSGQVELFADVGQSVFSAGRLSRVGLIINRAQDKQGMVQSPIDPEKVRVRGSGSFTTEWY
ncbi:ETX/MTX2 family pore-forming toxin [Listeria rocourtiae]|uniref:ETX/MTX2 family pore-forming toxin n=1 Tax=Listeria rocourtiae TaxID=647910 RepID=UPI003D2F8E88